jgi:nucleotide-binding universal stress UspA family protein
MKILLATDGSPNAVFAADILTRLPLPPPSALTILTVIDTPRMLPTFEEMVTDSERQAHLQWQQVLHRDAEHLLTHQQARFIDMGWTVHTDVRVGHAAHQIVQAANELKTDLVVLGSRGLSTVKRFLLGSVSQQVITYAPCSVLVAREPQDNHVATAGTAQHSGADGPWRLLVADDGSPMAQQAIDTVALLPLDARTEILVTTILTLITSYRMDILQTMSASWQEKKQAAQARLEHSAQVLRRATAHVTVQVREGEDPSQEIVEAAQAFGARLIVMGHRGRSGIERFFIGSVANRVVQHAPCSVWVVRT